MGKRIVFLNNGNYICDEVVSALEEAYRAGQKSIKMVEGKVTFLDEVETKETIEVNIKVTK